MRKLIIYRILPDDSLQLVRSVVVHDSFVGNGRYGVIFSEFKRLAEILEPDIARRRIEVVDL